MDPAATDKLITRYHQIKQPGLDKSHLQPGDIYPLIEQLPDCVRCTQVGSSFLNQPIYQITVGEGPIEVLAWSQMHGDEPTATAALFDLLSHIGSDGAADWRNNWYSRLTLHLVPMLNPDGAANATRVNAQGIDINRDAAALQSPEGQLLHQLMTQLSPDVAFNLHDQNRNYAVAQTKNLATISLLAPPGDEKYRLSPPRLKAMQVIALLAKSLSQYIPDHIGRYDDSYSPRAFGDLMSTQGISTILIESGSYLGDPYRQIARMMNFVALVTAIDCFSQDTFARFSQYDYQQIPMNETDGIADVLITGLCMHSPMGGSYRVDVALAFDESDAAAKVTDIGDLAHLGSYFHFQADGFTVVRPRGYVLDMQDPLCLTDEVYLDLLEQGFGYFCGEVGSLVIQTTYPVVLEPVLIHPAEMFTREQSAQWLMSWDAAICFAVIKGIIIDIVQGKQLNHSTI